MWKISASILFGCKICKRLCLLYANAVTLRLTINNQLKKIHPQDLQLRDYQNILSLSKIKIAEQRILFSFSFSAVNVKCRNVCKIICDRSPAVAVMFIFEYFHIGKKCLFLQNLNNDYGCVKDSMGL